MTASILLVTLLISISINFSVQADNIPSSLKYNDPDTFTPCYPLPTETSNFLSWDEMFLSQEWLEMAMKARNVPKKFKKASKNSRCISLYEIKPDKRRFYWEISCPYTVSWLTRFTWKLKELPPYTETCYVLFPCWQKVRIVNCTTKYCTNRCRVPNANVKNSICLENYFVEYKNVLVFCTRTYRKVKGKVEEVNCKKFPHFCVKKVTLRVPQSCECWQCWDMYRTDPSMISKYEAAAGKG